MTLVITVKKIDESGNNSKDNLDVQVGTVSGEPELEVFSEENFEKIANAAKGIESGRIMPRLVKGGVFKK